MKNIYQSIADIMSGIEAIKKDQTNKTQGFKFRGIDDVYNAIHPLLAKHGVFSVPTVLEERTEERKTARGGTLIYRILKIEYTFYASDGTSVKAVVIGEGMDSGDKAANKAMAIGHKYALLQIFAIPTEDMVDPDSESHEVTFRSPKNESKASAPQGRETEQEAPSYTSKSVLFQNEFTPASGYKHLVTCADGDKEYVNSLLKSLGLSRPSELTFDLYKTTLSYVNTPRATTA